MRAIKPQAWLVGAIVLIAVMALATVLYLRPGSINTVKEQSIAPMFVTPAGANGDLTNVDVGFRWHEQGYCVGQFHVKATETFSQIRIGEVVSRRGGNCAGIGSNGRWATAPLALRAPVGDREVIRERSGSPLPVFALTVRLRCHDAIASVAAPGPDRITLFKEVALPTRALQANRSGDHHIDPGARFFAKTGLLVAPKANLLLSVPEEWMGKASIGWGSPATHTMALSISGCDAGDRWLVFAGGFWVGEPACIPLLVHTVTMQRKVMIGVGKACPGQAEPPPGQ